MNAQEGVDLSKMAISVMLCVLVLSAVLSLFYFLYTFMNSSTTKVADTVSSTTTDKLADMTNASRSGETPLVTSVINAISEFEDTNVLYIEVTVPTAPTHYFTYDNINLYGTGGATIIKSTLPAVTCSQYLMGYSDSRCKVYYLSAGDEGYDIKDNSALDFSYITIEIIP